MVTRTLLALSLIAGGVVGCDSYNVSSNQKITEISQTVNQLTITEIQAIAQKIAVRVHAGEDRVSGIIIAKKNNIYFYN